MVTMSDRLEAAIRNLAAVLLEEMAAVRPSLPEPVRLLSVVEASSELGIARSTLYTEMDSGRLRSLTIGKRRLIPSDAIAAYIQAKAS